jgi:mRNA interferase RelE/StbE
MASYRIDYANGVEKDFRKIPQKSADRIASAIDRLAENPQPAGCVKLAGYDIDYRIRIGNYRVIYQIHDSVLMVLVIEVGHRKNVYLKK